MAAVPSAKLAGLVSLAPTGQGFMLPVFFSPKHSNSYLVQVLKNINEIKAFSDLVSIESVIPTSEDQTISPGDEPIWAFQISTGKHVVARTGKFRFELMRALGEQKISLDPFVKWEVERLFGREDDRRGAVSNLYRTMTKWNPKWADYWLTNQLILPTIRQEIDRITRGQTAEEIARSIRTLQIECSSQGVTLYADALLVNWLATNRVAFKTAMTIAENEWRDTKIGPNIFINLSKDETRADSTKSMKLIPSSPMTINKQQTVSLNFYQGRIIFDSSWSAYERELGIALIEDIAKKLSADGFDASIERTKTVTPPKVIPSYFLKAKGVPPPRKSKQTRAVASVLLPSLKIICSGDYRFLLSIFGGKPKSLALRNSETNILVFRTRDEAEEILTKLEAAAPQARKIAQVWIAEPSSSTNQMELPFFKAADYREPKYLGYIRPVSKRFSFSARLPELSDRGYFLIIADDQTEREAELVAKLMIAAKVSPQSGPLDVVICLTGTSHRSRRVDRFSLPGVHIVYSEFVGTQLLKNAAMIFSTLSSFSAGMFSGLHSPIIFIRSGGRRNNSIFLAANALRATIADINPSTPLERENRSNVRRAMSEASHQVALSNVAHLRSSASRGRAKAIEYYEQLTISRLFK